jgi:hypothetical protein
MKIPGQKMKRKESRFNNFFEAKSSFGSDDDELLAKKIRNFFRKFPLENAQYKIVLIVRILAWAILFGLGIFGAIRTKILFK